MRTYVNLIKLKECIYFIEWHHMIFFPLLKESVIFLKVYKQIFVEINAK